MKGLRLIAAVCCLALAGFTDCPARAPAQVSMQFTNNLPIENNTLTSAALGSFHISTTFSKSHKEVFTVGGLTASDFAPRFLVTFETDTDTATGLTCVATSRVELTLDYSPTVYIASEYRPGTCRYKQVMLHEVRHVNTDIILFNEYLPQMQADVQAAANTLPVMGPLKDFEITPARDKAVNILKAALTDSVNRIAAVQHQRQQAIDTRQEYLRGSKACSDEPIAGGR